jgi:CBS domain-containing protein
MKLSDSFTKKAITAAPGATLASVARQMEQHNVGRETGVRRLPVVDQADRLTGMVTLDDLLEVLGQELYNLAKGIQGEVKVR